MKKLDLTPATMAVLFAVAVAYAKYNSKKDPFYDLVEDNTPKDPFRHLTPTYVTPIPEGTTVYDKSGKRLATTTATAPAYQSTYCAPPLLWDWGKGKCMSRDEIANIKYTYSESAKQAEIDVNKNINKGAKIVTGLDYNAIYAANPEIAPPVMVSSLGPALASNQVSFSYNSSKLNGLPYGDRGLSRFLRRRGLRL